MTASLMAPLQECPATAGPAIRHADAAGVDDNTSVDQSNKRHMGVPADHGAVIVGQIGEGAGPASQRRVDEHEFVISAGAAGQTHGRR